MFGSLSATRLMQNEPSQKDDSTTTVMFLCKIAAKVAKHRVKVTRNNMNNFRKLIYLINFKATTT